MNFAIGSMIVDGVMPLIFGVLGLLIYAYLLEMELGYFLIRIGEAP